MRLAHLLSLAALTAVVAPATAQTIIKDNSTPVVVDGISEYQTDFNMVGGMKVTWTLTGGTSSGTWGSLAGVVANTVAAPAGAWGIWTNDFKLWGTGSTDTFGDNVWNLWARNLTSFTIEALFGNGVFDVKSCDNSPCSTPDSESGKEFEWDDSGVDGRVTYSNPIAVSPAEGSAFVGDLYGTLKVDFGSYSDVCPAGWTLYDGNCKRWTGAYSCPTGYVIYNTDECKEVIPTKCTGSGYEYHAGSGKCKKNNKPDQSPTYDIDDANKVYQYQDPTEVWQGSTFGTTSDCKNNYSPTVDQSGGNNQKCWEKFSQDMDNYTVDNPSTSQEVVPEPATMTLLATGLLGMAGARRRKQAAK